MNPGVDVPDPLTLPLHETAIVTTAVITFAGIVRWFQAQRNLTAGNADAVGVLIARRVAGQPYHEVDAGFGPRRREHPAGQGGLRREDAGGARGRGGSERAPARRGHPAGDQGRRRTGRLPLSPRPGGERRRGSRKVGAGPAAARAESTGGYRCYRVRWYFTWRLRRLLPELASRFSFPPF